MRRLFESYIMWLKQDLRLSDICKTTRTNLLTYLRRDDIFLDSVTSAFSGTIRTPFEIQKSDPPQISSLKKLLNALENAQNSFAKIEGMDINRSRTSLGITADVANVAWDAIHEFYAVLQLVNQSTQDVQLIVGPHLKELLPKVGLAMQGLQQFVPANQEAVGTKLADLVTMMPTEEPSTSQTMLHVSNAVARLPHYFEKMQGLINFSAATLTTTTSAAAYQKVMKARAAELFTYFNTSATQSGWSVFSSYFSTLGSLMEQSADLMNTGAPLTKQAYQEAVKKLNDIRHKHLPKLIAELEAIEESLGLKPSTLTEPMLKQMESYYATLATQVNKIAVAANVIQGVPERTFVDWVRYLFTSYQRVDVGQPLQPLENLEVLRDDEFMSQVREQRSVRLAEAEIGEQNTQALDAAKRFFDKIGSYGRVYQARCQWNLYNLEAEDKRALIQDYKLFQAHFARVNPGLDKLIVDSLTRSTSASPFWAVRLYMTLTDSNQFASILACRNKVVQNLEQQQAHMAFKATLIKESAVLRERHLYVARGSETVLDANAGPYVPLFYREQPGRSYAFYIQQQKVTAMERHKLQSAQEGLHEFFTYLREHFEHQNLELRDDRIDQEVLRRALQKFQTHFVAADQTLYKRLVDVLNTPETTKDALKITELLAVKRVIGDALEDGIEVCQDHESRYAAYAASTLVKGNVDKPLKASTQTGPENSSFVEMMNKLKLSESVDKFMKNKLIPYLRANLDESVFEQLSFETKDLPYLSFHKDSPDVATYKRIINAFYHLHKGLATLEAAESQDGSQYLLGRSQYVWNVVQPLVYELYSAKYYLAEATENPGLRTILNEGLQVLEPLQNLPIIGDLLKDSPAPTRPVVGVSQNVDVVAAWRLQQTITDHLLEPSAQPLNTAIPTTTTGPTVSEPKRDLLAMVTMDKVAEVLFTIPSAIEKMKKIPNETPDNEELHEQARALVASLRGLKKGPWSLQELLQDIHQLNSLISSVGQVSRELVLERVGELQSKIAADVFKVVDTVEFEAVHKPGALSNPLRKQFSDFFNALVMNLPFEQDQQSIELEVSTTITEQRLAKERERLQSIESDREPKRVRAKILGTHSDELNDIDSIYSELEEFQEKVSVWEEEMREFATTAESPDAYREEFESTLADLIRKFTAIYQKLHPYLVESNIADEFGENFVSEISDGSQLFAAIEQLQEAQPRLGAVNVLYEQLEDIVADRDAFLPQKGELATWYAKIRPYLLTTEQARQFSPDYITKITTESGLKAAVEELQDMHGAINYKAGLFDKLSAMFYFGEPFTDPSKNPNPQRDEFLRIYKELQPYLFEIDYRYDMKYFLRELRTAKDFDAALHTMVGPKGVLESAGDIVKGMTIGTKASSLVRDQLVELVEGRENSREHRMAQCQRRIDFLEEQLGLEQEQGLEKVEAFKHKVFLAYVHTSVASSFVEKLGPYAANFFDRILPDLKELEKSLLDGVTLEDDIEAEIAARVDGAVIDVVQKHAQHLKAYADLNVEFQTLKSILEKDTDLTNPLRKEKVGNFQLQRDRLLNKANFPDGISVVEIYAHRNQAQKVLKHTKSYDALIATHDLLLDMRKHISELSDADSDINKNKLAQIDFMMTTIKDTKVSPKERMHKAADYGLGERFNNIMQKDGDHFIIRALKTLASVFFRWQGEEEKKLSSLIERLLEVKVKDDTRDEPSPPLVM